MKELLSNLGKKKLIIVLVAALLLILAISLIWYFSSISPINKKNQDEIEITIPLGSGTSKIADILTNNDKAQEVMTMLAEKAEEKGLSREEWEQVKVGILTNCFFMVAMKDEQIRNDLGMDIYEALNA